VVIDVESLRNRRDDDRWNRISVGDITERVTWATPDKPALIATPDATVDPAYATVTYAEANRLVNRVANALLALDLEPTTRIAMLCNNSNEAWLAKIGIAKAGLVAAPVNTMMAADVMVDALARVEAELAIVDHALWQSFEEPMRAAGIGPLVALGAPDADAVPNLDRWLAGHDEAEPDIAIHGDDIWQLLFTSGTTAAPKAVMISHTYTYLAAFSHMLSLTKRLDHESSIVLGAFTPMVFHIGDQIFAFGPLMCGGTVVMGARPDGDVMADTITRHGVTALFGGSPQFLESLVSAVEARPDDYDLSSVTTMFFGWAALDPSIYERFRALVPSGVRTHALCSQTEAIAGHRFFIEHHRDLYERQAPAVNHVEMPAPIMAATIFDADNRDLRDQPGVAGEAVFQSPVLFSGYYRDREATEEALAGGWFHSGDSFTMGEDGVRHMVDRYKDIVKTGGENVSSQRVEAVLDQHPAVARSAVVGLPDDRWGEMVTACVLPADGATLDEDDIIAFARRRLAGFETPKRVIEVADLPTTVGGKILKYRLRERLSAD